MKPIDYTAILEQALSECGVMILQRQELDLEIAKKTQFIRATMNMLPDAERAAFEPTLNSLSGPSLGLTDAIRKILQTAPNKPFTATQVRDELQKVNFDFTSYKTNPLASIHAVLKRLKPEEVGTTDIDGVTAWRWVGHPLEPLHDVTSRWVRSYDEAGIKSAWYLTEAAGDSTFHRLQEMKKTLARLDGTTVRKREELIQRSESEGHTLRAAARRKHNREEKGK
jgi:hypothetical protein